MICSSRGAERGDHQRLGLAAGEQRRAVRGQHADLAGDRRGCRRACGRRCGPGVEHRAAHGAVFELAEFLRQLGGVPALDSARGEAGQHVLLDRGDGVAALQLVAHLEGAASGRPRLSFSAAIMAAFFSGAVQVDGLVPAFGDQFVDRVDRDLHVLCGRTSPRPASRPGQQRRPGFDHHQHGVRWCRRRPARAGFLQLADVGLSRYSPFL